jgi:RNA polymerase sigma factor (sigma-70 family)
MMRAGSETTDEALLEEHGRTRSLDALEELIRRHWAASCRLAARVLGDPAAAEDAAQDAFFRLSEAAPTLALRGDFAPFLRTLVLNAARDRARTLGRRRGHERRAAARRPDATGGAPEGEEWLLAEEIHAHVLALPVDVRFAVVLHFYEGRSHDEVAAALGCPRGTASSRIRRGLERLRESLSVSGYAAALPSLEDALARVVPRRLEEAAAAASPRARGSAHPPAHELLSRGARAARAARRAFLAKGAAASLGILAAVAASVALAPRDEPLAGPGATPASLSAGIEGSSSPRPALALEPARSGAAVGEAGAAPSAPAGSGALATAAGDPPGGDPRAEAEYVPPPYPYPDPRPTTLERRLDETPIALEIEDGASLDAFVAPFVARGLPVVVESREDGRRTVPGHSGEGASSLVVLRETAKGVGLALDLSGETARLVRALPPAERDRLRRRALLSGEGFLWRDEYRRTLFERRIPRLPSGVALEDAVGFLRDLSGLNVIVRPGTDLASPLALDAADLRLGAAFDRVLAAAGGGLGWRLIGEAVVIAPERDFGGPRHDVARYSFARSEATVPELCRALESIGIDVVVGPETWARPETFSFSADSLTLDALAAEISARTPLKARAGTLSLEPLRDAIVLTDGAPSSR